MKLRAARAGLVLMAMALAGCGGPEPPPNLLLIVVDTLRQDRLGPYGYTARPTTPVLDALAAESVVVEGLTSASSWTMPSMATLLTGTDPAAHRISFLEDQLADPQALPRVLRAAGYATACVMSNILLAARRASGETGFAAGFDYYDDEITKGVDNHLGSSAQEVTSKGLRWLESAPADKPWFLSLHYFDPHVVYEDHPEYGFPDPDYQGWVQGGLRRQVLREHQEQCTPADREQLGAYYDGEVRAVDTALGRLLAELRRRPDWKRTILVFTADHGEELAERGHIGHTVTLHFELLDLPLIVRLPDAARAGARVQARLPLHGLYATLLELCGLAVPAGRGASFAGMLTGAVPPADRPCWFEVDFEPGVAQFADRVVRQRGVLDDGYKLVNNKRENEWRLFDLRGDPLEQRNVFADPAHAAARARLEGLLAGHAWFELR